MAKHHPDVPISQCDCALCRDAVRKTIFSVFAARRRWMGQYAILVYGRLNRCHKDLYFAVLASMIESGELLQCVEPRSNVVVYMPSRLTFPAGRWARGGRG